MDTYKPEGMFGSNEKKPCAYTIEYIEKAIKSGDILHGIAIKCSYDLTLTVNLGSGIYGIIRYEDVEMSLDGEATKSIAVMTKVGKVIDFKVKSIQTDDEGKKFAVLSRREAQMECQSNYIDGLSIGQVIDAKVNYIAKFGVFCDIGCGITALLPMENICVTKLNNPINDLRDIKYIKAIVKSRDDKGRIVLTHKELLGTWEEEAAKFKAGNTVMGTVKSIKPYGIFVQLTPNLSGLAELNSGVKVGDKVSVYIRGIIANKMKVKLVVVNNEHCDTEEPLSFDYRITSGVVKKWKYSPESYVGIIETNFE